ncbi:hypothetical protein F9C07_1855743 [Aspergillus flavus]|uniref:Uncharacterized protein n=2 Tax=Aspergillus flavus TaxID=5059 RepID=A0A7U2MXF4_ASPFN|nr:hypothetical protein BDV35DRAFT_133 [Aspergillus flavus]KAF7624221.1 hypothetical protein AFLA_007933 [Aspergillus flavus NRRL3357]KOC11682.1 hypothetical protein AFLA70_26g004852 [Aspergillus flavus AF70]KAJ1714764.1 hypothetical protein NYO67_3083 [Aspergillus flavus]QRD91644.1 hypothetical protein F9C07_1855743 [Aspergillus flavus]
MATPVLQNLPKQPKRVILQLRVDQFTDCLQGDFEDAIEKYLVVSGRSMSEIRLGRHFIHIEPFQSDDVPQKYFHIVLDLEQSQGPVAFCTLPHELFHIRRSGKGMQLLKTNNQLVAENMLRKIRFYTDELYPWGRTRV